MYVWAKEAVTALAEGGIDHVSPRVVTRLATQLRELDAPRDGRRYAGPEMYL